ncbi:hypothetical protein [Allomuricauda sp. SCSIO 65647]|uniref:hypothetical protein n=1 Tax=Allomuricauda sp. SCSIO 65647 TaxID=2908843 RepID=UPI001F1CA3E5|nr:hypothetical protein [Muricauda sp. SCSIO 65647]UJH66675.1 hypothetical protein L0P89_11970 [Muricauda sp. SCSIO 65647]
MRTALTVFSLLFLNALMAQNQKKIEDQFLLNVAWPGVSYEFGIATNTSIRLDAATSLGVISFDNSGFDLYPRFDAQLRRYYNFDRRAKKGKLVKGNSGNFYGINMYYTSDISLLGKDFEPDLANIIVFGPASFETFYIGLTYGLQRTYTSGFNWGLQFGIGAISVDYTDTGSAVTVTDQFSVYPNLRVTIGWVLGKKD